MKNLLRWCGGSVSAAALLVSTASVSQAGGNRFPKAKAPPKILYTAIASVDATAMTITTESKNSASVQTKTYKISPKVKVMINGQPKTVADLKPGLQIRVGAGMDAGVAEELSAMTPPADPVAPGGKR